MGLEHIEGIYEASQDKRIWEHMSVDLTDKRRVIQYVEDAIQKREQGTDFAYVIVNKNTGKIIGATWFLDISNQHKRLEIGSTWVNPIYWRSNINTNCKYLLLKYCFEELSLNRVQIKTGHKNIRSQKAIERIGAVKEGILRNHMIRKEGTIRHTVLYSVIKEEWDKVKRQFEERLLY
ncbi:GNAT family N-acetyltransferase [Bacillus sp. ISL-47]|uniref:GNAT family N-acetyltransferase n=1 Tax=Bacillus sp. ISL-47 TaxID=2819130 RepID=UPI001BE701DD|nr:GNAT family N-acetyltransferase [Bacillus sp. ISL-47]MBT2689411.1 GNAT family N-acetyltransferase [Bacillus sp. ISL-47]MBT2709865.1 GNAT family N-acetyltransferase [Pseudomonas sp. ISL-84]